MGILSSSKTTTPFVSLAAPVWEKHKKTASSVEHHACIVKTDRIYLAFFLRIVVQICDLNIMHSCIAMSYNVLFLLVLNTTLI